MNVRLILAIIGSLLDEAVILFIVLWVLPQLGVRISLPWLIAITIAFAIFAVGSFKIATKALSQKPLAGLPSMIGIRGIAAEPLEPRGFVKVMGELWEAETENGSLDTGMEVVVTGQQRLRLYVREADREN